MKTKTGHTIHTYEDVKRHLSLSCDVCVVGSGAGGAPMAKELAEAGLNVILVEEGAYHEIEEFRDTNFLNGLHRLYRNAGATMIIGKPGVLFSEGRCVGGSTTINGGMCWRTPNKILKRWQWENGLIDVTPDRMEFYFDRVEKMIHTSPILPEAQSRHSDLLKAGADRLGYRVQANLRSNHGCVGTNMCSTGCPTGGKQPTLVNYIPAFLAAGGQLYTQCRVKKVLHRGGRATGISGVILDPNTRKKKASIKINSKMTVVCGGAVQTPALLLRSHLSGRSKLLGKNLFVHPNTKVVGVFDDPVYGWKGVSQAYQVTEFMDEGILFGVNFVPPAIMPMVLPYYGEVFHRRLKEVFNHCVVGAALIEDTSRGRVYSTPFDEPFCTYDMNARDFETAKRATALLTEIYFAAGAKRVYLPFHQLPQVNTVDDIKRIYEYPLRTQDLELMTVHVMGTCQMGTDHTNSVVDSFGEVHGTKGLFVADASIFPTSIGVNPQESIMAFSTRTAFYIIENLSRYMI